MSRFRNTPNAYVWRWSEAPEEYRKLSQHGGDEDYVIVCVAGDPLGKHLADQLFICDYQRSTNLGRDIYITSHA